jgi:DMSO/TMAO reductase YedYZ heme-binding membrane subunit
MLPMALGSLAFYFLIMTVITSKARKKIGYQKWRKLHGLNPILYILVTIHGLFIGSDFQGVVIAAVNIVPLLILGVLLLFDRKKTQAIQH